MLGNLCELRKAWFTPDAERLHDAPQALLLSCWSLPKAQVLVHRTVAHRTVAPECLLSPNHTKGVHTHSRSTTETSQHSACLLRMQQFLFYFSNTRFLKLAGFSCFSLSSCAIDQDRSRVANKTQQTTAPRRAALRVWCEPRHWPTRTPNRSAASSVNQI